MNGIQTENVEYSVGPRDLDERVENWVLRVSPGRTRVRRPSPGRVGRQTFKTDTAREASERHVSRVPWKTAKDLLKTTSVSVLGPRAPVRADRTSVWRVRNDPKTHNFARLNRIVPCVGYDVIVASRFDGVKSLSWRTTGGETSAVRISTFEENLTLRSYEFHISLYDIINSFFYIRFKKKKKTVLWHSREA